MSEVTLSACRSLSPGRVTLLPLSSHPPLCTVKGEDPNTGSLSVITTSLDRISWPTLEREMLAVQALEIIEAGSSTVTLERGLEVSCSNTSEEEFNRNWGYFS